MAVNWPCSLDFVILNGWRTEPNAMAMTIGMRERFLELGGSISIVHTAFTGGSDTAR